MVPVSELQLTIVTNGTCSSPITSEGECRAAAERVTDPTGLNITLTARSASARAMTVNIQSTATDTPKCFIMLIRQKPYLMYWNPFGKDNSECTDGNWCVCKEA